jgi:hypothetical protein
MARAFVRASSQYLEAASAIVSAPPWTMSCWFNSDDSSVQQALGGISRAAGDTFEFFLEAGGSLRVGLFVQEGAVTTDVNYASGSYSANAWHHAAYVIASTTSRTVYLNGSAGTEGTASVTPSGMDTTSVGRLVYGGVPQDYMSGRIAELAFWSVALTAAEIASLAKGFSALLVRPQSLVEYWPLIGRLSPETGPKGAASLTVTGATAGEHVRVYNPTTPAAGAVVRRLVPRGHGPRPSQREPAHEYVW